MKKQILYIYAIFTLMLTPLVSVALIGSATAAAPGCYSDATGVFQKMDACPASGARYVDLKGGVVVTPVADKCYASTNGSATYTENLCANFELLAQNALQGLCTASSGAWVDVPPSSTNNFTAGKACKCSGSDVYSGTSKQCVAPGTDNTTNSKLPQASKATSDCNANGGDLDESNCGIVGLLNTVFNFVSGGIGLAVVINIIYAGIQYSTAQGDPSAVSKSKTRIRNALIAFLMYLSLSAFIQWLIPGGVF